jgi:hypothetical protein
MSRKPAAVSMQPQEYEAAKLRAQRLGMNFSAYINALIRADMRSGGDLVLRDMPSESLPPPGTPNKKVEYNKKGKKP